MVPEISVSLRLTGTRGVLCRTGDVKLIFSFTAPVTNCGALTLGTVSAGHNTNQCTVTLPGPASGQCYQVGLNGVVTSSGGSANVPGPQWGLLFGDVMPAA